MLIAGSAANYAKTMQMTQEARQRIYDPKNFQVKSGNENVSESDLKRMAEQQNSSGVNEVQTKMRLGQELSDADLELLRKENPQLYQEAMKVVYERRAYEKRLNQCRTKDEVEQVKLHRLQGFASEVQSIQQSSMPRGAKESAIGFVGMRMAAVSNEHAKFVKSERYAKLPWERDLEKKKKAEGKGAMEQEKGQEVKPLVPERDPELQKKIDDILRKAEENQAGKDPNAAETPEAPGEAGGTEGTDAPGIPAAKGPSEPVQAAPVAPAAPAAPAAPVAPAAPAAASAEPAPARLSVKV